MRPTKNTLDPARPPPWLTTQQVAALLGVHEETVRRWAADGTITARKVGQKLWRYPSEEVAKLI